MVVHQPVHAPGPQGLFVGDSEIASVPRGRKPVSTSRRRGLPRRRSAGDPRRAWHRGQRPRRRPWFSLADRSSEPSGDERRGRAGRGPCGRGRVAQASPTVGRSSSSVVTARWNSVRSPGPPATATMSGSSTSTSTRTSTRPHSVDDGALDWMGVAHLLGLEGADPALVAIGPRSPMLRPEQVLLFANDNLTAFERGPSMSAASRRSAWRGGG